MKSPSSPALLTPARKSWNWCKCLAASAISAFVTTAAIAAPSSTIVISQVYGGGGNSGAPYTHDFVELHNISESSVDVTGWSIQYAGATSAPTSWDTTTLSGAIPSGAYYLVQLFTSGAVGSALPSPDATGTSNLNATGGKIALSNTSTALTGSNPIGDTTVVDFVGYGTSADAFEGAGSTAAVSNTKSAARKDSGSQDTDDNSVDFETGTVGTGQFIPRNSSSPVYLPATDTTPPAISSRIPGLAATGVSLTPTISITFDEPIAAGAGGVQLYKEAGVSDVLIPIGAVGIAGSTASFTPAAPLEAGTTYYVLIDSTAFTDTAPALNPFPGISDQTAWTFNTAVAPVLDTFTLANAAATTVSPNVTLNYTASGGAPAEYIASEQSDFSDATWTTLPESTPVFTLSAGNGTKTVYIKLRNSAGESGVLSDSSTRADYAVSTAVIFTQYYEGDTGSNKYVEITNTTGGAIDLAGWNLVRWANEEAENWKVTGSVIGGSSGVFPLSGVLAAGQTVVFANPSATFPSYVSAAGTSSVINHNGNDSYGLYQGTVSPENLRDAIGFTNLGYEGADTSFVRSSAASGFDFSLASTVLVFPAVWQQVALATVNAAVSGQNNFLGTYPGTNGYGSWADLNVEGQTASQDYDGDGIDNGTEYFIGTNPAAFTANQGIVAGTVTWPRAAGTTISSFAVEVSTNLSTWEDASLNYSAFLAISATEVSFSPPLPASGGFFVRLRVTP